MVEESPFLLNKIAKSIFAQDTSYARYMALNAYMLQNPLSQGKPSCKILRLFLARISNFLARHARVMSVSLQDAKDSCKILVIYTCKMQYLARFARHAREMSVFLQDLQENKNFSCMSCKSCKMVFPGIVGFSE